MARFLCICGETLSNSLAPNDIQFKIFSDIDWDKIINQNIIDPLKLPEPTFDAWRCPKCQRVYLFKNGEQKPQKRYILEE